MRLLGEKVGAREGRWFRCMVDEKSGETVEMRVRPVPASEERRQNFERFGRKQTVQMKKGARVVDVEGQLHLAVDKACYALLDSRNADVEVMDEAQARVLKEALAREVAVGETVRVDGKWTDAVKHAVLSNPEAISLVRWINERADSLMLTPTEEDAEEEIALGKT